MYTTRRSEVHRRSLLLAGASVTTTLALPRGSRAASPEVPSPPSTRRSSSYYPVPDVVDLKTVGPSQQVTSIHNSDGTYRIATVSGATLSFPEFDLRFKTDSGARGPAKGRPVLVPASIRNDRAFVIFADPHDIGAFLNEDASQS